MRVLYGIPAAVRVERLESDINANLPAFVQVHELFLVLLHAERDIVFP